MYIYILSYILDKAWPKQMKLRLEQQDMSLKKANIMSVDALATLQARASTAMVLTPKGTTFCLQHQKN